MELLLLSNGSQRRYRYRWSIDLQYTWWASSKKNKAARGNILAATVFLYLADLLPLTRMTKQLVINNVTTLC